MAAIQIRRRAAPEQRDPVIVDLHWQDMLWIFRGFFVADLHCFIRYLLWINLRSPQLAGFVVMLWINFNFNVLLQEKYK